MCRASRMKRSSRYGARSHADSGVKCSRKMMRTNEEIMCFHNMASNAYFTLRNLFSFGVDHPQNLSCCFCYFVILFVYYVSLLSCQVNTLIRKFRILFFRISLVFTNCAIMYIPESKLEIIPSHSDKHTYVNLFIFQYLSIIFISFLFIE